MADNEGHEGKAKEKTHIQKQGHIRNFKRGKYEWGRASKKYCKIVTKPLWDSNNAGWNKVWDIHLIICLEE